MTVKKNLIEIANKYPKELIHGQLSDVDRISFHINLAINSFKNRIPPDLEICDLGGGLGMFSIGCVASKFKRTLLIDDFNDPINHNVGNKPLDLHRQYGVEIYSRDVIEKGIGDLEGNFDIITSFDSMEHWHNSPKNLFHEMMTKLNKNGTFILGVPNCVNLRKRITVPFGYGKWSSMELWYEEEKFRGHVREPDIADLLYIAKDIGLSDLKIIGRNWLGLRGGSTQSIIVKALTKIIDPLITRIPSLCSNLYLVGKKKY